MLTPKTLAPGPPEQMSRVPLLALISTMQDKQLGLALAHYKHVLHLQELWFNVSTNQLLSWAI